MFENYIFENTATSSPKWASRPVLWFTMARVNSSAGPVNIRDPRFVITGPADVLAPIMGARPLRGTLLTEKSGMFCFKPFWLSMITYHVCGPDDVIQTSIQSLTSIHKAVRRLEKSQRCQIECSHDRIALGFSNPFDSIAARRQIQVWYTFWQYLPFGIATNKCPEEATQILRRKQACANLQIGYIINV